MNRCCARKGEKMDMYKKFAVGYEVAGDKDIFIKNKESLSVYPNMFFTGAYQAIRYAETIIDAVKKENNTLKLDIKEKQRVVDNLARQNKKLSEALTAKLHK